MDLDDGGLHVPEALPGTIGSLRLLMFERLPPALRNGGLAKAVRELLRRLGQETRVTFEIEDRMTCEPSFAVAAATYRILQEALGNVCKHASAHQVTVVLASDALGQSSRVRDDGEGFEPDSALGPGDGHLGLTLMRERAERFGGWLHVLSEPGIGTSVLFWLPSTPLS